MSIAHSVPLSSRMPTPAKACEVFQFTWSTTPSNGTAMRRFCVRLEMSDAHRGCMEAWLESGAASSIIMPRQAVWIRETTDGGLRHVDALTAPGGPRLLAATLMLDAEERGGTRLLYIATPLLGKSGLNGGAYHPPTFSIATK